MTQRRFYDVLLPAALGPLTYELPDGMTEPAPGCRVTVPLRRGESEGIVIGPAMSVPEDIIDKLRPVSAMNDNPQLPFIPPSLLELILWTARYYMSPEGAVLKYAIPAGVWKGVKRRSKKGCETVRGTADRPELSGDQAAALSAMNAADSGVFLLHGVTGSGKTEIYLRAVENLPEGKGAIVLVPEIALTGQIIDRFRRRFGNALEVYHSGLSNGERAGAWRRARSGEARVVLGVRSAVFLPFENLGLVIVDEEHSATYKQWDGLKYNARDLAVVRGRNQKAKVILGSATPSMESFYNALKGKYALITMPRRIEDRPMPAIRLIDMKKTPMVSPSVSAELAEAISDTMAERQQALFLISRRGYAPAVICEDCGHLRKCALCNVSLTWHKRAGRLRCHHCGGDFFPAVCPKCGGLKTAYVGEGTERAEEELAALFPNIGMARMDTDTTSRKDSHRRIIRSMESGQTRVLLGTQMVAKGHDLPGVTLAGAISADVMLGLPDFRAAERGYHLFSQLAGRAGRGNLPGRVLIQTRDPENYLFEYVAAHDYEGFFRRELEYRRETGFPPFRRLARIVLTGRVQARFDAAITEVRQICKDFRYSGARVFGPSPCPLERLRGLFRWHLLVKSAHSGTLHSAVGLLMDKFSAVGGIEAEVDIDPVDML
ncbi:MAG: primosomal protein N' [Nitrospirae bacterium]|nr:primosomal protein N' [Nitrospirota bacterium]